LTWAIPASDGGSSIEHYCVYRSEAGSQPILLTTVAGLSYSDEGLINGRHYSYSVAAVTIAGEGPTCPTVDAVPATIPTAPASISAQAGNKEVLVTWQTPISDGGGEITAYNIYRSVSGSDSQLLATTGNVLQYRDQGLGNEITYTYKVSAINWVGEGYVSAEAMATTDAQFPTSPRNLAIQPGNGETQLSWSAPTDTGGSALAGYLINRTMLGGQSIEVEVSATTLSYHDINLANGEKYSYSISAFNQMREGLPCSLITVMPQGKPSIPLNLNGLAEGAKARLVWSAPASDNGSAIIGYEVLYGPSPDSLSHLFTLPASVTSHLTEALQAGSDYWFAIVAINGVGRSPLSSPILVSIADVPTAPLDPRAIVSADRITVTWSQPYQDGGMPILAYDVHRSVDGAAEISVAMVNAANCTYIDMDVSNGHNYSYSVHAVNAVGEGALSAWVQGALAGTPGQPLDISWTTGEASAAVTWSEPLDDGGSPITGYSIYMGIDGSQPVLAGTVSALERSWAQVGLEKNRTYQFFVTAINAIGEGMPSSSISLSPMSTEVVYVTTNIEDRIPVATLSSGVVILLGMTGSVLFWRGRKARAKEFTEALDTLESLI
jgi:fibronectin type 3 domain-containing protein